jgi:thiol-disulfide isomerase/thioredoxin
MSMASPESAYRRHLSRLNELISDGGSLSGYEKNCAFLNINGDRFATVSATSGLDFDDDARSPVSIDWDRDGDLDLWVANRTAPQLRFLRNDMSTGNHFVSFRLRGTRTNRDGIGARVEVFAKGEDLKLIKTLKAGDGFLGQSSKWVHFGLGKNADLAKVVVRWSGGEVEEFNGAAAGSHFLLTEGSGRAVEMRRDPIKWKDDESPAPVFDGRQANRIITPTRAALPPLRYEDFDGTPRTVELGKGRPVLVNLWASWCPACQEELKDWKVNQTAFKDAGIDVVAVSVDEVDDREDSSAEAARKLAGDLGGAFTTGVATREFFVRLQQAHDWPFRRRIPMPVPISFLVDGKGRLTAIYRGSVSATQVASDVGLFNLSDRELLEASLPFKGRWMFVPPVPAPMPRGIELMNDGDVVDAAEFAIRNLELLKPHREFPLLAIWISEKLMEAGDTDRGLMFLRWAAEGDQSNLAVVNNLAWQLAANPSDRVRNPELALKWAEKANAMTGGKHPAILDTLAVALAATGDFGKAIMVVEQGIKLSNESEAAPMRERLALFQKGQPYREPLPVKK